MDWQVWLLAQGRFARVTLAELNDMPAATISHHIGFTVGYNERQQEEAAKQDRAAQMRGRR